MWCITTILKVQEEDERIKDLMSMISYSFLKAKEF